MEAILTKSGSVELPAHLTTFARSLRGEIILPGDEAYDASRRVWNTLIDRSPSLIVRAAHAMDVVRTVLYARAWGLRLAVRSGGHSMAGHGTADDAIVLDLGGLRGLHIDPERREAWAQPGLTCGEYTAAAHAHGLATPFGDTGSVGLGGITLGGGIGWLARKHGMTIDSLISVEIVTADGQILNASHSENPELFWAVSGGGGNFGIVTRFHYRLHPVETVLGGTLFLPATNEVLQGYVPAAMAAPDELTTIATLMHLPPLPFVAPQDHGRLAFLVAPVFAGDMADAESVMAPIRALAEPIADMVAPMPYPAIYEMTAEAAHPTAGFTRSMFLDSLDTETIDTVIEHMGRATSPMAMIQIRVLGGAMARVPAEVTAFAHRRQPVLLTIITVFSDPAEAKVHEAWTESLWRAIRGSGSGVYSNFLEDEGEDRVREAYPGTTYPRLVQVKRAYDPTNLFALNQNIAPR